MTLKLSDITVMDSAKQLVRQSIAAIRQRPELDGAVRFGIVEYQDQTRHARFVSHLTSGLTSEYDKVLRDLDTISPVELKDDFPDDVIAGLNTAITKAGWSENSSKHVVLIGMASCQLAPPGKGENQFGFDANGVTKAWNRTSGNPLQGWNTSGLSISQLIARANPEGGSTAERARRAVTFHSILVGRDLPTLPDDLLNAVDKVVHMNDAELEPLIEHLIESNGKDEALKVLQAVFAYHLVNHQRKLAQEQYREISRNNGIEGLYLQVEPDTESIRQGTSRISTVLGEAFTTLAGVRDGRVRTKELEAHSNQITQRFYALVGAAAAKFKDEATLTGTASVRDERGRETAQRKVLVSRAELQRLQSTLDAIYKKFQSRVAKIDRQDVSKILDELKEITVATATGQPLAPDAKLRDVISDLPLRTNALDISAADIAVMPSDTFTQWLNKVDSARLRASDLLDGKAEWLELSPLAANDKFTFLRLNDLP